MTATTPGIPDPPLPYTGGRIPASEDVRRFAERRVLQQYIVAPALSFAAVLIGFSRRATSSGDRLAIALHDFPSRLGGLILIAWAMAMLAVGAVEALDPAQFSRGFESIFGNPWPFGRR